MDDMARQVSAELLKTCFNDLQPTFGAGRRPSSANGADVRFARVRPRRQMSATAFS
jgi:hypothetical protein